jgi:hypothetical protein
VKSVVRDSLIYTIRMDHCPYNGKALKDVETHTDSAWVGGNFVHVTRAGQAWKKDRDGQLGNRGESGVIGPLPAMANCFE